MKQINIAGILTLLIILFFVTTTHADLIALYTFEGNTSDVTGNGNNGEAFGSVSFSAPGIEGLAADFNGLDSYINLPININPDILNMPYLTMGAWVKADVGTRRQALISHGNAGYDRQLSIDDRNFPDNDGDGTNEFGYAAFYGKPADGNDTGAVLNSQIEPITTDWVFISAVYDGDFVTLWVNDQWSQSVDNTDNGSGLDFTTIGRNPTYSGVLFDGQIDNVFFFNEALTENQISYIRDNGADGILDLAVPEPNTILLLGTGLIALVGVRRKTKK